MKAIFGIAALTALLVFTTGEANAKEVRCKCGDKEFTGNCPDNKDAKCDCKDLKVVCTDKKYPGADEACEARVDSEPKMTKA
ncbi:hypothetical protein [Paucibacter soli]|uniref:hypothetical protein n=1 Tax=Paucibacter soli TaxID=3133433 RepID=UPI0030A27012